ncbi:hypothetical protein ACOMHN_034016 [Nucella lapillus]
MMKHAIDIITNAVKFLNPGQNPVIACDQPLFALAKQIQWRHRDLYGESRMTVVLGGLHTEMAFLKALGSLLRDSGWTDVLVQAGVTTVGTADSFLSASHVTKTRHAHQLTVCALYQLMNAAYEQYRLSCQALGEEIMPLDEWKVGMTENSPTFHIWALIMQLEVLLLAFLSSVRSGDFMLYQQTIAKMMPVFFALDQHNYARWMSVHVNDMKNISAIESVRHEFQQGHFVLRKTGRPFSRLALDHAHEQNNAIVKGDGGAVGLTGNPAALGRWMVSGPEVARVIQEFHRTLSPPEKDSEKLGHHEESLAFQVDFANNVKKIIDVIKEAGNPFAERSCDFLTLQSTEIISASTHEAMKSMLTTGMQQYTSFVEDRLKTNTKKFSDPIKRNNMVLIAGTKRKKKGTATCKLSILKKNNSLFSRLYIACQTRPGGLDDFFQHENHSTPPSLSSEGQIRPGLKSRLMECLEQLSPPEAVRSDADVLILDGAVIVHMIRPGAAKTFRAYAEDVFLPHITHLLQTVSRLDVIWDVYRTDSLKNTAREMRGKGKRRRVTPTGVIPPNWHTFLRIDDNKTELFQYLAQCLLQIPTEKTIVTTQGTIAISNAPVNLSALSPCTHEEADSRIMTHLVDAAKDSKHILIRTTDTDVVVLAVASASRYPDH